MQTPVSQLPLSDQAKKRKYDQERYQKMIAANPKEKKPYKRVKKVVSEEETYKKGYEQFVRFKELQKKYRAENQEQLKLNRRMKYQRTKTEFLDRQDYITLKRSDQKALKFFQMNRVRH